MDLNSEVADVGTLHGLSHNEIRFFYTSAQDFATEFKIWTGTSSTYQLYYMRQFYMRRGPFSSLISAYLVAYYQFMNTNSKNLDDVFYDYSTMQAYSNSIKTIET